MERTKIEKINCYNKETEKVNINEKERMIT
jgi:hypothetical protein